MDLCLGRTWKIIRAEAMAAAAAAATQCRSWAIISPCGPLSGENKQYPAVQIRPAEEPPEFLGRGK